MLKLVNVYYVLSLQETGKKEDAARPGILYIAKVAHAQLPIFRTQGRRCQSTSKYKYTQINYYYNELDYYIANSYL